MPRHPRSEFRESLQRIPVNKVELSGWGGYPRIESRVAQPIDLSQIDVGSSGNLIMRGQGRSYGDAAILKSGVVVLSERLNSLSQIGETGSITAAAGATLDEVLRLAVPKGWFPAVVPGTKHVSVGGCIAADVHGKNHHRDGSFANHVIEFTLRLADGARLTCAPSNNAELFWATTGGMGLTGIIESATVQLIPIESILMSVQYHQATDLDETLALLNDNSLDDQYTVIWLDCTARGRKLGRSVLLRGHHAAKDEVPANAKLNAGRKYNLNFDMPSWLLNPLSVSAFNEFYYRVHGRSKRFLQHYEDFFFPLDRIGNWNRMYGRRGFIQYQCVFPLAESERALRLLLEELRTSGYASFLSVLKLFGPGNKGPLSFPIQGYTLTLDLPIGRPELFEFLDRLDELVLRFGGRVYLAKDARMSAASFPKMYSRLPEWQATKRRVDPETRFQSNLSQRLRLC